MNKRIKKKRKAVVEHLALVQECAEYKRAHRWAMMDLEACKQELRGLHTRPAFCTVSVIPTYPNPQGFETHRLQVNAPLRIDHTGPLHEPDVMRMVGSLTRALRDEAITQLMKYVTARFTR